jgi:hypothetical protein
MDDSAWTTNPLQQRLIVGAILLPIAAGPSLAVTRSCLLNLQIFHIPLILKTIPVQHLFLPDDVIEVLA